MADDTTPTTRLVVCSCGRALMLPRSGAMLRVREETERGSMWIVYVDGHFHHLCSLM